MARITGFFQRPDTGLELGSGDAAPSYKSCRSQLYPATFLAVSRAIGFFGVSSCRAFAIEGLYQDMQVSGMPYKWPLDTDFALWELDVLDRACPACGRMMHICDHRYRRLLTLKGPVQLVCKLNHCPDRDCPGHDTTKSPEQRP